MARVTDGAEAAHDTATAETSAQPQLRVTALQDRRRRAGLAFGREPVTIDPATIDQDKLGQLLGDPLLQVEFGMGEEFIGLPRGSQMVEQLLERFQEFGDAAGIEALASDTAKAARDQAAPIGGGATGSGLVRSPEQDAKPEPGKGAGTLQEPDGQTEPPIADAVADAVASDTASKPVPQPAPAKPVAKKAPAKKAAAKKSPAETKSPEGGSGKADSSGD